MDKDIIWLDACKPGVSSRIIFDDLEWVKGQMYATPQYDYFLVVEESSAEWIEAFGCIQVNQFGATMTGGRKISDTEFEFTDSTIFGED